MLKHRLIAFATVFAAASMAAACGQKSAEEPVTEPAAASRAAEPAETVDADLPDPGMPIPADENHIHFGDGSTATELTLAPGEHTLRLILGDHLHIPHDPPVTSDPITITVK